MKELNHLIADLEDLKFDAAVVKLKAVREEIKEDLPYSIVGFLSERQREEEVQSYTRQFREHIESYLGLPNEQQEQITSDLKDSLLSPDLAIKLRDVGSKLPDNTNLKDLWPSYRSETSIQDWHMVLEDRSRNQRGKVSSIIGALVRGHYGSVGEIRQTPGYQLLETRSLGVEGFAFLQFVIKREEPSQSA